jgi:hypothetical protein
MKLLPIVEAGDIQIPDRFMQMLDAKGGLIESLISNESARISSPSANTSELQKAVREEWPALAHFGTYIARMIDLDPGFVVVRGLRFNRFPQQLRDVLLLSLFSAIGTPTDHNGDKRLLWPITPRPVEAGKTPTFSEYAGEAPLHTDSAFVDSPERFLSLFVVREAEDGGGKSVLLSGAAVLEALDETEDGRKCHQILRDNEFPFSVPDAFYVDRRFITAPVIAENPLLRFRYDCIMSGFDLVPELKTPDRIWAVEYFNKFIADSRSAVSYQMRRGELIIFDNHRLLHSRTNFIDPDRYLIRARMHSQAA